jgi:CubicO group peptidase (beta-lactamase class C family)
MRSLILLFVAGATGAACSASAAAQSPARDAAIDAVFARWSHPGSPGCAVGVVDDGRIAFARGYGLATLEHDAPMTSRTVFYAASVSKQFTTAAVILLAQDGRLSLDDDVRTHFPELPDYGARITVRHLIHHTSGLRDYLGLMAIAGMRGEDVHAPQDVLELIARQRELNFPPGSEYLYSNSGYFLLSELVRRTSGQSLRDYAHSRLFAPLGMTATHFHDDRLMVVPHRAIAYSPRGDGWRINVWFNFEQVGSGGLMTSVDDLAKWDRNFYSKQVGGEFLHAELHRRGVLTSGDTIPYAGGLVLGEQRGLRTVRHGGSTAGYRTDILRFPEQRVSVITLCNASTATPGPYADAVAAIWLGGRMAPAVTAAGGPTPQPPAPATATRRLSPAAMAAYVGHYESDETRSRFSVEARGDSLFLLHRTLGRQWLRPVDVDGFRAGGSTVQFHRDGNDRVSALVLHQDRVRAIRFLRAP